MSIFSRSLYRTRQFITYFRPRVTEDERTDARKLLGEQQWRLFESMTARDQRHSLDTFRLLKEQGSGDTDLLVAGLLHDVGKGRLAAARVRIWHRVLYVAFATLAPPLLRRLSNGRGGLADLSQHAERGAVVAEALGVAPGAVELIRRHHEDDTSDERIQLLREADDAC